MSSISNLTGALASAAASLVPNDAKALSTGSAGFGLTMTDDGMVSVTGETGPGELSIKDVGIAPVTEVTIGGHDIATSAQLHLYVEYNATGTEHISNGQMTRVDYSSMTDKLIACFGPSSVGAAADGTPILKAALQVELESGNLISGQLTSASNGSISGSFVLQTQIDGKNVGVTNFSITHALTDESVRSPTTMLMTGGSAHASFTPAT